MGFSAVEAFPKCNILSVNDTSRKAPYPVFSPSPFPNPPDFRKLTSPRKPTATDATHTLEQFAQNPHLNKVTLGNKLYARVRSTCCGRLLRTEDTVGLETFGRRKRGVCLGFFFYQKRFLGSQEIHRKITGKSIDIFSYFSCENDRICVNL